ncbi:MAG: VTT domain-containing protein [bacterium]|nr:VTT domain-containing protein [bacterium]
MKKKSSKVRAGVIVATCVIIALITLICGFITRPFIEFIDDPEKFRVWIDSLGVWGVLIFLGMVILQIIAAVIPGEPFEIAAGYAFGAVEGTIFCMLAEGIGSLIVLFLVRKFGVKLVESIFSKEKIESVKFLKASKSKLFLFTLIFIVPGTPKDLLCYYGGLTDMNFGVLSAVCFIGRFPSVITSVIGGSALGEQNYIFAVMVFAVTAIVSLSGIMIFNKINTVKEQKTKGEKKEK